MTRTYEPAIRLATLKEDAVDQVNDFRQLTKAGERYEAAMRELDPDTYAPAHRAMRQAEIQKHLRAKVDPLLARIAERKARAAAARESWDPARRRLAASLSDPVASAAIVNRLATVGGADLVRLAQEAAERNDWLLADAVVSRVGQLSAEQEAFTVGRAVRDALQGIDRETVLEVHQSLAVIGQHYARAQILNAELAGRPLSPGERLNLIREFPEAAAGTAA